MPSRSTFALSAVVAAACSGCADDGGSKPRTPPAPATAVVAIDAGVSVDAGVTTLPSFDPGSGYHLDDAPVTRPATGRPAARDRKPVQILLRSTPTGAIAAVDGVRLGPTPVLWEGVLDGQPREFTFVMAGHTLARYRFVPITGGIVHGSLTKLTEDRDAGTPAIPPVEPRPAGSVAAPPERPSPPPPPVDAAPPPPPPPGDAAPPPVSVDAGASTGLGPTP